MISKSLRYLKKIFEKDYNLKVADIAMKNDKTFVIFQCFQTNTFVKYSLDEILENDVILSQVSPKSIRLLSELNLYNSQRNKIALVDDGAFVYNKTHECFYTTDELVELCKDNEFMERLNPKDAYLLGYIVGQNQKKIVKPKLLFIKR